ncbi:hypothetical protein Pan54_05040 [Rubinisphaera italica]|uniref:Uncharacterized protein n=1 Tax=Rubinisphaera italica TaxID=2527969 RepID=A0A5C5XAG8_9PLAN|nr:hypothetical protein Pan54_05040 [Rubinisphaera italica]
MIASINFDFSPVIAISNRSAQSQENHIAERMGNFVVLSWIRQVFKEKSKRQRIGKHCNTLVEVAKVPAHNETLVASNTETGKMHFQCHSHAIALSRTARPTLPCGLPVLLSTEANRYSHWILRE